MSTTLRRGRVRARRAPAVADRTGPGAGTGADRLTAGPPAADGTVVLDFNYAVNLPCAHAAWQPARCR
ncbi:DUF1684 domain-containing protein [Streptomyces pseudovenezuelae]|uniref:DUF1684 domain-containing protein n=1 Tax=Streptomyces pseudovenezuelae TaxID=67350 RepID=UPI002E35CDB5|nr:DUF1684 domain-containing protein [Streptomyces pseudovenezuelae]